MDKCIYIIDDEKDILNLLKFILTEEGYNVQCFSSGEDALRSIEINKPDLILLDLMLPGISGFEICKKIKNNPNLWNIPVIVISSRTDEFDIVTGITLGCDDYLTKPFSERILLAKIKAFFEKEERQSAEKSSLIKFKDLIIDPDKFELIIKGRIINLTPTEFKVFCFLVKNKGRVFSREQIFDANYEYSSYYSDRSIDILIGRIRKKIGSYAKHLESIYGVGYRFKEEVE